MTRSHRLTFVVGSILLIVPGCGNGSAASDEAEGAGATSATGDAGDVGDPDDDDDDDADEPGSADDTGPGPGPDDGDVEVDELGDGMGTLTSRLITLPEGHANAVEVYQLAHYIARTDQEINEQDIDIAMRNYVAACDLDTDSPRLFVSQTLAQSEEPGAETFGSLFELRFDASSGSFASTDNAITLPKCYESHGVAVSPDCSRVAVLCNRPHKASESDPDLTADLVAPHAIDAMLDEDNHEALEAHTMDPEQLENGYKENDQIWLLEWNDQPLATTPDQYVVSKNHGGTFTGAQELIYVDDDSQGRTSYGFSMTARVFDHNNPASTHYSSTLSIVDRDAWVMDLSDEGRGWYWACGDGHNSNIRAFYNPAAENYGALCTSDGADDMTHGGFGTIAIKMEDDPAWQNGRANHYVPAHSSLTGNGGGHTVVPLDDEQLLTLIVSPRIVLDEDMERFLEDELSIAPGTPGPHDEACYGFGDPNCFISFMQWERWQGTDEYQPEPQSLFERSEMTDADLTRIGIARVNAESGSIARNGYRWVATDDDCQLSDPQLVDLRNGRYLLGYARFQCKSDGLPFNRIHTSLGADRLLIPKDYYLAEIDVDGNIVAGPVVLPNHGWGGVDEPTYIGSGRVAWMYLPNPTYETYGGGQNDQWEVLVYESAAP